MTLADGHLSHIWLSMEPVLHWSPCLLYGMLYWTHPQQIRLWYQAARCSWQAGGKGWYPEGPWTSLKGGPMKAPQISTGPTARSCTWVGAIQSKNIGWARMDWDQPWGRGLPSVCEWGAWHDLVTCASTPESQSHCGLHEKQSGQQDKGGDSAPVLFFWNAI